MIIFAVVPEEEIDRVFDDEDEFFLSNFKDTGAETPSDDDDAPDDAIDDLSMVDDDLIILSGTHDDDLHDNGGTLSNKARPVKKTTKNGSNRAAAKNGGSVFAADEFFIPDIPFADVETQIPESVVTEQHDIIISPAASAEFLQRTLESSGSSAAFYEN